MLDLAIVIVNWNVKDLLAACLRSVQADLAASQLAGEVWVVDNASSDGSIEMLRRDFPNIQLIASQENLGFARGNNLALQTIGFNKKISARLISQPQMTVAPLPKAVLLLNPDTEVSPGALLALVEFLEINPQAGVAGAKLVYGDGSFQHSAFAIPGLWQLAIELLPLPGRLIESRLNGRYPRLLYEQTQPFEIGHPLGAAMCVRREAIEQVGLLDESYHMYVEEVDWGKRILTAGWKAYCVPTAKITHFEGQSTGQIKVGSFINLWSSRHKFYQQHYSRLKVWVAAQIVRLGMQRKIGQDKVAAGQGQLDQVTLRERLIGYQEVIKIWQGKRPSLERDL